MEPEIQVSVPAPEVPTEVVAPEEPKVEEVTAE